MSTTDVAAGESEPPVISSRFWFKVFNEVNSDLRFATLSSQQLGVFVRLSALANTLEDTGVIWGSRDDIAFALRLQRDELDSAIEALELKSLVFATDDRVEIADKRPYMGRGLNPSDTPEASAERTRRSRANRAAGRETTECRSDTTQPREDGARGEYSKKTEQSTQSTEIGKGLPNRGESTEETNERQPHQDDEDYPLPLCDPYGVLL